MVSGLPRSGTSLMMQMLGAGGLALATDGVRAPDADNPRGYYELEAVKRLADDASFLAGSVGKVVKVVAPLLQYLPEVYDYRVIFMQRDLGEILASQRAMLARTRAVPGEGDDAALRQAFEGVLYRVRDWLAAGEHVACHFVAFEALLRDPPRVAAGVADFLARHGAPDLDVARMASAVDPALGRRR